MRASVASVVSMAVGMAAVDGLREGAAGDRGGLGVGLADRRRSMRWRSRCQTSSGKAGSPISRAASCTALPSSAGSDSDAQREAHAVRARARRRSSAPRSAQASPSAFSSIAGSPPRGANALLDHAGGDAGQARPAPAGSRRLPASKSICTSTIGSAWAVDQVDLRAAGQRPVLDRDGRLRAVRRRQRGSRPAARAARCLLTVEHASRFFQRSRRPALRGRADGGSGRAAGAAAWPTVSWSSPKYLAATACTCSAVTPLQALR